MKILAALTFFTSTSANVENANKQVNSFCDNKRKDRYYNLETACKATTFDKHCGSDSYNCVWQVKKHVNLNVGRSHCKFDADSCKKVGHCDIDPCNSCWRKCDHQIVGEHGLPHCATYAQADAQQSYDGMALPLDSLVCTPVELPQSEADKVMINKLSKIFLRRMWATKMEKKLKQPTIEQHSFDLNGKKACRAINLRAESESNDNMTGAIAIAAVCFVVLLAAIVFQFFVKGDRVLPEDNEKLQEMIQAQALISKVSDELSETRASDAPTQQQQKQPKKQAGKVKALASQFDKQWQKNLSK